MVGIRATVVVLPMRSRASRLRVLVDSGSTSNYISARCQIALELVVKFGSDFERLTLVDGTQIHAQGYV